MPIVKPRHHGIRKCSFRANPKASHIEGEGATRGLQTVRHSAQRQHVLAWVSDLGSTSSVRLYETVGV